MTIKINGTNTTAQPSITGPDTDTGLVYGTDEVKIVTTGGTASTNPHVVLDLHNNNTGDFGSAIAFTSNRNSNETTATIGLNQGSTGLTNLVYNCTQAHIFKNNTTNLVRIDSDGLKFNADTDAVNALDDYEEGAFTPTIKFGSNSSGMTFATGPFAKYTKIGRQVFIRISFRFNNKGTSTGDFAITGLPFEPASIYSYQHPLGIAWLANSNAANRPILPIVNTGSVLIFRELNRTDNDIAPTNAYFDNDTAVMLSLSYETS